MNADQEHIAQQIAELLDADDAVWQFAAEAIGNSRDMAARTSDDRDSGDVLNDLIAALRSIGDKP